MSTSKHETFRLLFAGIFMLFTDTSTAQHPTPELREFLGPTQGKTYVYAQSASGEDQSTLVTVAGAEAKDANSVITCSPASVSEFPDNLRKLGATPVLSTLEVTESSLISVRGHNRSVLLQLPLHPGPTTWDNVQKAVLPNGKRSTTTLHCGIASAGTASVFGEPRATISVECIAKVSSGEMKVTSTYAAGIGPFETTTEYLDNAGKSAGTLRLDLKEIRDGASECQAAAELFLSHVRN
jgi:hypothetical protein